MLVSSPDRNIYIPINRMDGYCILGPLSLLSYHGNKAFLKGKIDDGDGKEWLNEVKTMLVFGDFSEYEGADYSDKPASRSIQENNLEAFKLLYKNKDRPEVKFLEGSAVNDAVYYKKGTEHERIFKRRRE